MKGLNVITIGLCIIAGMTSCKQQTKQTQPQSQASAYKLVTLAPENRTLSTEYSAVVEGKQYVEVRPQVSGVITKVLVKEGAKVKKGETLFVIDTIPYAAAYQQAKAAVASAKAQVATSKLALEGKEELYKEKVISDFELQTARNSHMSAEASLALAKAQLANAANNLSFAKVKSPVNGFAGMTSVRVGTLVSGAMGQPLINVSDNSQVYVYFSLSEKEVLKLIKEYGSLEKTIASYPEVALYLNDGSLYEHKGKIDVISNFVDKSVVRMRAVFDNPEGMLINGSTVTISIPYEIENRLVIPQAATYEIQDQVYTYKVVDGKAVSTKINVYRINNGREYVVEDGLSEGDVIIAEGAGLVKEGALVKAAPEK